ncbi:MAG: TobH protein [Mycobacterium sp.]
MSAAQATIDLDDVEGLLAADREGLLRAASMAGAQMRTMAAALDEGVLEPLRSDQPPRTVVWVATRGAAEAAGAMLAAALGGSTGAPIVVASEVPPWIGALDVMIVAGDDPADPVLVSAAATGIRRGARVVVVAPDEGPLREVAAGRAAVVLAPRLLVSDEFALVRYLSAGLAALQVVDSGMSVDLAVLADALDAEALRNSAGRELFTNPAKALAERLSGRDVVLAGGNAASVALARHVGAILLRVAQQPVAAVGLADALVALRRGLASSSTEYESSIFHDEEIDGPQPARVRTVVFATDEERPGIVATLSGYDDVEVVSADDVPDLVTPRPSGRPEQQLVMLAVRLEMAAAYLRLVRG